MNNDQITQTVKVSIDVPVGDVMTAAGYCSGSDEDLLPTAAAIYLNGRCGDYAGFPLLSELANSPNFEQIMAAHGYERVEQSVPSTDRSSLSGYMRLEGYSLPEEWLWMDDAFAEVETTYRDRGVDLLRVGPSDVGVLIHDMTLEFEEVGYCVARDLAEHRRGVAAFELEVLSELGPDCEKVAQWPISKMARQSDWLKKLPFEARRRAAIDVSERLDHELDKMEIPHADVVAEAEARFDFLSAVHKGLEAASLGGD